MKRFYHLKHILLSLLLVTSINLSAYANLKPYVLSSSVNGNINSISNTLKAKLTSGGFTIVGEYSPYKNAKIIAITNDQLINTASKSKFGAYGAAIRVALTKVNGTVQISYTNPPYWASAFRMKGQLKTVADKLRQLIGLNSYFGSKEGLSEKELRKYHYMFAMPYFDDHLELMTYKSYEEAIKKVEEGFKIKLGGVSKVYRIDIPGKKETVFGVHLTKDMSSDKTVMDTIDKGKLKHTAHLCYEMIISDNKIYALNGRFRIAISFPDLTMGSFTKIMSTPGDIEDALKELAGYVEKITDDYSGEG